MSGLPLLTVAELVDAGRDVPAAFRLRLGVQPAVSAGEGQHRGESAAARPGEIECREVLRLLPGRRLVARVEVAGREALLKLFLGTGSQRYCARERAGCRHIAAAGLLTPGLLATVTVPVEDGGTGEGLLFEFLDSAQPLDPGSTADLLAAAEGLARLHAAGYRHRDLHLDNFLRTPAGVYLIDGDGVREVGRGPGRRSSLEDLAMLCAQRPPLNDGDVAAAAQAYARAHARAHARARGWQAGPRVVAELQSLTRVQRRARLRRYLEKAQRDCTEFLVRRRWRSFLVAVRPAWNDALAAFVADPERAMAGAAVLKDGNSATVVRLRLGERSYVVKRYNHKNAWQALRRNLRPTARFRRAWCNGQRLHMLHIPTARPLLLLERRFGPLRGVAYLVMEDLGDVDLATAAAGDGNLGAAVLQGTTALLRALAAAGLVHGDTKASNFLLTDRGVAIVDLDALHEGEAGRAGDLRRFLANFDGQPALRRRFEQALGEAGLV